MTRTLAVVITLAASMQGPACPAADATTLDDLLAAFRELPGLEASFREEKRIALLAAPLVSEGTLHFVPPSRLVRHTLTPDRSTLLIEDGILSFGDARQHETIDLDRNPLIAEFVNGFLQILEGRPDALRASWRIDLSSRDDSWEMTLQPRSESIGKSIRDLTLRGAGTTIRWMRFVEMTGDETVTTFSEIDTAKHYTRAEIRRLFRIPPA